MLGVNFNSLAGSLMRIPRIYHPETIHQLGELSLSEDAAGHIGRVLRMKEGQEVLLFDGSGAEFPAVISGVSKKSVEVELKERVERSSESPLDLHLGQVISRGDKMEFTIQKVGRTRGEYYYASDFRALRG